MNEDLKCCVPIFTAPTATPTNAPSGSEQPTVTVVPTFSASPTEEKKKTCVLVYSVADQGETTDASKEREFERFAKWKPIQNDCGTTEIDSMRSKEIPSIICTTSRIRNSRIRKCSPSRTPIPNHFYKLFLFVASSQGAPFLSHESPTHDLTLVGS